MWHLLGKFSACSFCGGVFGAFGWGCFAQAIASRYLGRDEGFTQQQRFRHLAESYYWLVPWLIGYGVEVLCMSVCMIMVADRLVCHVGRSYKLSDKTIRRISLSFFALVVVLCSAGLVANVAVGVYNAQTAVKFSQAADACLPGGNSTARSGESLARSLRRRIRLLLLLLLLLRSIDGSSKHLAGHSLRADKRGERRAEVTRITRTRHVHVPRRRHHKQSGPQPAPPLARRCRH